MTKRVGLIGYPLGHSISPVFQQAALDHLNIDALYELWSTPPDDVKSVVDGLRSADTVGSNVTVPYKETVLPMLDEQDKLCRQIGACNTIVNSGGKLVGYNTDALGFIKTLRDDGGFDPKGKSVVVLGSGGVARAAGYALVDADIDALTIVYDIEAQADKLASGLRDAGGNVLISKVLDVASAVSGVDLIVNCTPFGMKGDTFEGKSLLEAKDIPVNALVYDVVYNPLMTQLLINAKQSGAKTLAGLSMLVYQGAAAFELWTGKNAPVDVMMKAARSAL
ncbi:MAG: shikimate dehydrogenase [Chloroflexi bacterium]|mgnify:CR=1 FL=1|jgi:shikimate dehydrogenase|nr:shikimate dehydrogenase [Chloroflexota bacterium]MBT7081792.1 shikimate dehydrogenase [Chloroflexota bacterium]MBT7289054.1 shikimate dehydrogenase [Chloroflexota bacterium]